MITEAEIVDQLTESVSGRVSTIIRESLSEIAQQEISKAPAKALLEGTFYRSINQEVIGNIENIYSVIRAVKKSLSLDTSIESLRLLTEADSLLDRTSR